MPLLINLRHLEEKDLVLKGELTPQELELEAMDELIHLTQPLEYDLTVEKLDRNLLVQGKLNLVLQCECSRCLRPFALPLAFKDWICHVPLEGEDAAAVDNDRVDLTPYLREDILLAFPQHPLCEAQCGGLEYGHPPETGEAGKSPETSSTWAELNKLKFDK